MLYNWEEVRTLIAEHRGNIALHGPAGVGKSHAFLHYNGKPVTVQCHEGMLANELFIGRMPRNGSMVNVPGPAAIAVRDNRPLLLQELDRLMDEAQSVVYMLADNEDTRVISWAGDDDEIQEYRPTYPYRVLATSNQGPDALPEALASRFLWIEVDEPAPEALGLLPKSMREAARVLAGHPDPVQRVCFRSFLRFDQLTKEGFDAELAARAAFGKRGQEFLDADRLAGLVDRAEATR